MKKMFSLALALIMALALCVPTFAVEEAKDAMNADEAATTEGSITITNAKANETYSVYRIFDLESYNNETGAFSYKINSKWGDWAKLQTTYVTVDEQGYVTWVEGANAVNFAAAALAYAKTEGAVIAAEQSKTASADGALTFDDLTLGYYLIDSSLGTLCSLDTTNNNVDVIEKNSVPSVEKFVEEDSKEDGDDAWGETNNADIGQVVNFKSIISIPAGAGAASDVDQKPVTAGVQNLVLHDVMDPVLVFQNDIEIYVDGSDEALSDEYYDVELKVAHPAEGEKEAYTCTFEVVFAQTYLNGLSADAHTFVVTYSAEVSADAVADTVYENTTGITYGDNSESVWDTTETKTYDFDLLKYTMNGEKEEELDGAEFELTYADENGEYDVDAAPIKFVELTEGEGDEAVIIGYRVATEAEMATATSVLKAGSINILGLDADVYYLTETKAPDGYNKLAAPIRVEITDASDTLIANPDYQKAGAATADKAYVAAANDIVKVLNLTGTELPSTGGVGTTIFYTVGGVMMAAAVVLFITKKKLTVQE